MANNTVRVEGMFGGDKTYFADSPVVIDIKDLEWPQSSPFTVVRLEVVRQDEVVADYRVDVGGASDVSFEISSALRTIWADYQYAGEVAAAQDASELESPSAITPSGSADFANGIRLYRDYFLRIYTEYISSDDGGVFVETQCKVDVGGVLVTDIPGGQCLIGGLTEWERSLVDNKADADASSLDRTNLRNGDASTKPISTPERVGRDSITSWVDVNNTGTKSVFFSAKAPASSDRATEHAPLVLRDSMPYTDFLFVNRRGAVETCSAQMLEAMNIEVETTEYTHTERASFNPVRSLMAISKGGRRSWSMSSGLQTREWTEWWTREFLMARKWWMMYEYSVRGEKRRTFVPVVVKPAKKSNSIYDKSKQKMESTAFTVTLALEG